MAARAAIGCDVILKIKGKSYRAHRAGTKAEPPK